MMTRIAGKTIKRMVPLRPSLEQPKSVLWVERFGGRHLATLRYTNLNYSWGSTTLELTIRLGDPIIYRPLGIGVVESWIRDGLL